MNKLTGVANDGIIWIEREIVESWTSKFALSGFSRVGLERRCMEGALDVFETDRFDARQRGGVYVPDTLIACFVLARRMFIREAAVCSERSVRTPRYLVLA